MKEYIDREEAIKEFSNNGSIFVYGERQCKAIISRLNTIPAADVRPVVRAKWKIISFMTVQCTNCQETFHELEGDNFCPTCGAMMEKTLCMTN